MGKLRRIWNFILHIEAISSIFGWLSAFDWFIWLSSVVVATMSALVAWLQEIPSIWVFVLGLVSFVAIFILLSYLKDRRQAKKAEKEQDKQPKESQPQNSFSVEIDRTVIALGDYERICAVTVKNVGSDDLIECCLVKIEHIFPFHIEGMSMPFVLRTDRQIRGNKKEEFSLASGEYETIPVIFRSPRRKLEWFFFDEFGRKGEKYFLPIPDDSLSIVLGVYGGQVNRQFLIEVKRSDTEEWGADFSISNNKRISLREAAVKAYEETQEGSLDSMFAEKYDDVHGWYGMRLIKDEGAFVMSVYGRKPPSRKSIRIPNEHLRDGTIRNKATTLENDYNSNQPRYVDLEINVIDFEMRLKAIKQGFMGKSNGDG